MTTKFVSEGIEISIQTNIMIENKHGYEYNALYKVASCIIMYDYEGEYPYSIFKHYNLSQAVVRNHDCILYVLYRLQTQDYDLMRKTIHEIENNPPEDINFEWVKGNMIFKDQGFLAYDLFKTLSASIDTHFQHWRRNDKLKMIYSDDSKVIGFDRSISLSYSEQYQTLIKLILSNTDNKKYVAALNCGNEQCTYMDVKVKNWQSDEQQFESVNELYNFLYNRCEKLYEVTDVGMKLIWKIS